MNLSRAPRKTRQNYLQHYVEVGSIKVWKTISSSLKNNKSKLNRNYDIANHNYEIKK